MTKNQEPRTPRKRRLSIEQQMQIDIIKFCDAKAAGCRELRYLFHTPNGGLRSTAEAGILKAMGVRPGVSDLFLPVPKVNIDLGEIVYIGLWLELKKPGEEPTQVQEDWLRDMQTEGHLCRWCESMLEALLYISWYLGQDWSHELQQMRLPSGVLVPEDNGKVLNEIQGKVKRELLHGTPEMVTWAMRVLDPKR